MLSTGVDYDRVDHYHRASRQSWLWSNSKEVVVRCWNIGIRRLTQKIQWNLTKSAWLPIDFDKKGEIEMGGPGSGNWCQWGSGYNVEDCLALDINKMVRDHLLELTGRWGTINWSEMRTGKIAASVKCGLTSKSNESANLKLSYNVGRGERKRPITENIHLQTTNPHLGGVRWWFTCPNCYRRVAKLYIPPSAELFLCRHCYRLTYQSQRESPIFRYLDQAQNIRAKLGGSTVMDEPFPEKPNHMHWSTFEKWRVKAERYEQLCDLLAAEKFGFKP